MCLHVLAYVIGCGADVCVCADEAELQGDDDEDCADGKDGEDGEDGDDGEDGEHDKDEDSKQAAALTAQLQAGAGSNADMQQQLAVLVANTSVIALLKNKVKELTAALHNSQRQLIAAEQENIDLHGVEYDKNKLAEKVELKDKVIKGLRLELATLKRKVVSYAKATLGACVCVCVCVYACVCMRVSMRQTVTLTRARVAAAAESDLASDGDAAGKGQAQPTKGSGKGKQGGKGGKAGSAGGKSPGKASREPAVGATAASVKQSQRERGRQSLGNCVNWFCELLDHTPRSTQAVACGMLAVCLLVSACCAFTYSWRCRWELRAQQGFVGRRQVGTLISVCARTGYVSRGVCLLAMLVGVCVY